MHAFLIAPFELHAEVTLSLGPHVLRSSPRYSGRITQIWLVELVVAQE